MAAFIVVVVQPWGKGISSGLVAGEGLAVGPVGLQGAVEPFDLAVLPGAVGPDEHVSDPPNGQDFPDRGGAGVGQVVIIPSIMSAVINTTAKVRVLAKNKP